MNLLGTVGVGSPSGRFVAACILSRTCQEVSPRGDWEMELGDLY
jgi:hypothetical protein